MSSDQDSVNTGKQAKYMFTQYEKSDFLRMGPPGKINFVL